MVVPVIKADILYIRYSITLPKEVSKMSERIMIAVLVLLGLIGAYISISGLFIVLLLGALLIPPLFVIVSISREGMVILKELKSLLISGKDFLVISISKENITLEPQVR